MTFLLLLFALVCLFSMSKTEVGAGFAYLSRHHTCFINGFFIIYVFLRHISEYSIRMSSLDAMFFELEGHIMGQLLVSTFLFFSGYGIQLSLQNKGRAYVKDLVRKRFLGLLRNFALAVLIYVAVQYALGNIFSVQRVALSLVAWSSVGNSNWFIFMTLVEYLIIAVCYAAFSRYGRGAPVLATACVTLFWTFTICFFKEYYWFNTIMCVPMGMFLALFRDAACRWQVRMGWRVLFIVLPLVVVGRELHVQSYWWCEGLIHPYIASCLGTTLSNTGAVLFAGGIALLAGWLSVAGFMPTRMGKLLVWCGGPALFYLYIFQRLPMLVGDHFGMAASHGYAYFILCLVVTVALAWLAMWGNDKLFGNGKR